MWATIGLQLLNIVLLGITTFVFKRRNRLRREGYARLTVPQPDDYAPHRDGGFPTPSGKVEIAASMAAGGNFVAPLFRQGVPGNQDGSPLDTLPTYHPPEEIGVDPRGREGVPQRTGSFEIAHRGDDIASASRELDGGGQSDPARATGDEGGGHRSRLWPRPRRS